MRLTPAPYQMAVFLVLVAPGASAARGGATSRPQRVSQPKPRSKPLLRRRRHRSGSLLLTASRARFSLLKRTPRARIISRLSSINPSNSIDRGRYGADRRKRLARGGQALKFRRTRRRFASCHLLPTARARPRYRDESIKALRIQPAGNLKHPLAVRELSIESDPPVGSFIYPVEFKIDVDDEPKMKDWARTRAKIALGTIR